jgi:hypothetical protein
MQRGVAVYRNAGGGAKPDHQTYAEQFEQLDQAATHGYPSLERLARGFARRDQFESVVERL